jgi:hypothetical protein
MRERLEEIDTSAIVELDKIKEQRTVLSGRLNALEERKDSVSPTVYARVRADYEARYAAIGEQARPFKEQLVTEYAKLGSLLNELMAELDDARLTQEEAELRHSLGEFEGDEFDRRVAEVRKTVDRCESDLAEANELRDRFIDVFESGDRLPGGVEVDVRSGEADREVGDGGRIGVSHDLAGASETPAALPGGEQPPEDAASGGEPGREPSPITAPVSVARLELRSDDNPAAEYPLQPGTTTIGRSPRNDICIREASVSRHHAKIVFAERGFVVYDLGSENGVFVNGERVKERLLAEGDEVEFGPGLKPYVFCGP